jgi:hypothetical protein
VFKKKKKTELIPYRTRLSFFFLITMSSLRDDGMRKRFVTDPHAMDYKDGRVHIGFLTNQHKGWNVFSPTKRFGNKSSEEDVFCPCSSLCFCFPCIYKGIRNFVASSMMSDMEYRHCELAFDQEMFRPEDLKPVDGKHYTQSCYVAYGTNLNEKVLMRRPRSFEPIRSAQSLEESQIIDPDKAYKWIHLKVARWEVQKLIQFCEAERGKKYDVRALERMPVFPKKLKPSEDWEKQKWHCTNFTVCMIQQIGFLVGIDPNGVTADDVYTLLDGDPNMDKTETTPAKLIKEALNTKLRL